LVGKVTASKIDLLAGEGYEVDGRRHSHYLLGAHCGEVLKASRPRQNFVWSHHIHKPRQNIRVSHESRIEQAAKSIFFFRIGEKSSRQTLYLLTDSLHSGDCVGLHITDNK